MFGLKRYPNGPKKPFGVGEQVYAVLCGERVPAVLYGPECDQPLSHQAAERALRSGAVRATLLACDRAIR
jgi:hypothetical protein